MKMNEAKYSQEGTPEEVSDLLGISAMMVEAMGGK